MFTPPRTATSSSARGGADRARQRARGLGNLVTGAGLLLLLTWWVRHCAADPRRRIAADARRTATRRRTATATARRRRRRRRRRRDGRDDAGRSVTRRRNQYPATLVSTNLPSASSPTPACDLPQAVADELGIEIVPLTIRFGDEEFVDRARSHARRVLGEVRRRRRRCPRPPRRRPASSRQAYRELAAEGATGIVVVSLSGALSATMQSAELAARVGRRRSIPVARRRQPQRARSASARSPSPAPAAPPAAPRIDEVAALATDLAARTKVWGALDTLENLKKGGRIGGAKAMLAIGAGDQADHRGRDGKVEQGGKQRTRSKALAFLVDKVVEYDGRIENLAVLHADCSDVDQFVEHAAPALRRRDRRRRHRPGRRHPRRPRHDRRRLHTSR